ncbi:DUF3093 domain-containing protein [soil metagenome]
MTSFRERMYLPVAWWLRALVFIVAIWWIFVVSTSAILALIATLLTAAVVIGGLARYGGAGVEINDGWLTAGRASIELDFLGDATVLDRELMRQQMGTKADARAYIFYRSFVDTGVMVEINDPRDTTPYWLLSSRNPDRLVAALSSQ